MTNKMAIVCFALILSIFAISVHFTVFGDKVPYRQLYFQQTLDHFNFYSAQFSKTTFEQRVLVQDKWWDKGRGPIFFYTGNEGPITTFWDNTGFVFDIAPKFRALVIFAEHRFYGKSLPFGTDSFKHPNVDLLTVEQALADYAVLLTKLKQDLNATACPTIAFGGSYGGMLSAYFRFKYPNVVDGAIAASAPIYLVGQAVPRDSFFFQTVSQDFTNGAPDCDTKVRQAFQQMQTLSTQGSTGMAKLSAAFHTCTPLHTQADYIQLLGWVRTAFVSMAMMDYPYPTSFLAKLPAFPVKVACKKMVAASDVLQGLLEAVELIYGSPKCHHIYQEYVQCADPTGCGLGSDSLAWDYQACTEMMMPGGTNNVTDIFPALPFTPQQRWDYCSEKWGVTPRDDWVAVNLWGKDIKYASNIVFSNGNLDPWHGGGVLTSVSETLVAVMIEGGAHHLDLRSKNPLDPQSVIKARQLEEKWITHWIQEKEARLQKGL